MVRVRARGWGLALGSVLWPQLSVGGALAMEGMNRRHQVPGCLKRTDGSIGAQTGEAVEVVDADAAVLTRLAVALVDLDVAQSTGVARLARTAVVVGAVDAAAVTARRLDAIVRVHLAPRAVVACAAPSHYDYTRCLYPRFLFLDGRSTACQRSLTS